MHVLPDFHPLVATLQKQTLAVDFGSVIPTGAFLNGTPTLTVTTDNGVDATPSSRLTSGPTIGTLSVADGGTGIANAALFFQLSALVLGASYLLVYSCNVNNGDKVAAYNHVRAVEPR
jgi:hypothetical protein